MIRATAEHVVLYLQAPVHGRSGRPAAQTEDPSNRAAPLSDDLRCGLFLPSTNGQARPGTKSHWFLVQEIKQEPDLASFLFLPQFTQLVQVVAEHCMESVSCPMHRTIRGQLWR